MSEGSPSSVEAYRRMAMVRAFERTCLDLSAQGVVAGSIHLCLGQEAVPVGTLAALSRQDRVVATYRGHGWAIECGVSLVELLAEVCHRQGGINGGRGGSALLSAPAYGFYGENSIVGAGVPIAAGLAMQAAWQGDGVVVVSIGDGAINQGSTHEGLAFAAAMNLPLIVVCENNHWSEMTRTSAMVRTSLTERVAGYGIDSRVVDGCDAAAVQAAVSAARETAIRGGGPVFLECRTVRLSGHYNRDIQHYRPKADQEQAERDEPLARLRHLLVSSGAEIHSALHEIEATAHAELAEIAETVAAMPVAAPASAGDHVVDAAPVSAQGPEAPGAAPEHLTYQRAVNAALRSELAAHAEAVVYGEDVGRAGGIFGVTRKLQKEFGEQRVFDTPISESAILGSAVGASLVGMRPIVEIMWADFLLVALDQLVNQAANVRYLHRGELHAPLVVRTQQGATPGSCAQHSQSLEALLAHVPGLKVGLPATPHDAYAMLRAAADDPDPCVLIEARSLYQTEGPVWFDATAETVGGGRFHRVGTDVAIVTWGAMLGMAQQAAELLAEQDVDATVLDLRWLSPLDDEAIDHAVRTAHGRVVVAHEANTFAGFGAEVTARIHARHPGSAKVERLGAPDVRIPAAPSLQHALLPGAEEIVQRCVELVKADRAETAEMGGR